MGDPKYTCPLCCSKTFSNKQSLQDHLTDTLQNLYCPICKNKLLSLVHLVEHLNLVDCQPDNIGQTIVFDTGTQEVSNENTTEVANSDATQFEHLAHSDTDQFTTNTLANNEMYVEFLSKPLSKPCLQTQGLKLVRDSSEHRESYFVVTQDNAELNIGHTIVTKQNKDGTISLTAVKDMKIEESETLISQSENEVEDSQAEIYSCNTCGVSFSSVLDHIQNYHNDQEVVVEEPLEEGDNEALPIENESLDHDHDSMVSSEKHTPRRVITDTGDIVEAPMIIKSMSESEIETIVPMDLKEDEVTDNEGRVYTRRYVQIDKLCDSVIKDIKESDDKGGPYHKVVLKEVLTSNGSNVKMYHCMSCNIYVSSLNEFKSHPCKTLKFKCLHCPVAYENSKSLCAHMKVHKTKAEGNTKVAVYECEVCCTVFPSNKSLKLHKRMHDPIKARPIEPPLVNRFGKEPSEGRYCCPTCDKMIPIDYKTIHQNSHKTSDKMNCQICNKKFSSEEYLEMHMTVHNIDKVAVNKQDKSLPYNCLYCNRRFARPHEKVKHERIHTGEKPHSCEICGKSFRVSYCLTLHMRTHTGARPYACPHCGKRFKAHSVFNHHLLTHSEVRAYKCPYCPKAFKTSVQLAGHKNSHTKPFSCQHCNRPFASLYAVRVHTETHSRQNNLKFSCSLCGASYARAFALKDHVKQIHKQDIESVENLGGLKEEDWIIRDSTDLRVNHSLKPALTQEINQPGLSSNELIVP